MTGKGTVSRRLGRVGVAGLLTSTAAAFVYETPKAAAFLEWFVTLLVEVLFYAAVVLAFLVGLAVIVYSHYKQRRDEVTDRTHRITGLGVCSVLGLSLVFPLVLVDDFVRLVEPWLAAVGPAVPTSTYFYASIALFGSMTLVRVLDLVTRRFRTTHA